MPVISLEGSDIKVPVPNHVPRRGGTYVHHMAIIMVSDGQSWLHESTAVGAAIVAEGRAKGEIPHAEPVNENPDSQANVQDPTRRTLPAEDVASINAQKAAETGQYGALAGNSGPNVHTDEREQRQQAAVLGHGAHRDPNHQNPGSQRAVGLDSAAAKDASMRDDAAERDFNEGTRDDLIDPDDKGNGQIGSGGKDMSAGTGVAKDQPSGTRISAIDGTQQKPGELGRSQATTAGDGAKVQKRDDKGNPVFDGSGKPVMVDKNEAAKDDKAKDATSFD